MTTIPPDRRRTDVSAAAVAATLAVMFAATHATDAVAQATRTDSTPPHAIPTTPRTPPGRPLHAHRTAWVDSLRQPESVLHDPARDVYYVSNMDGPSAAKDGRGFITRLRGDGSRDVLRWIASGSNGVTLHAPKGMALAGDTLWVSDIDALRAFDANSGRPLATVDLAPLGATFLNDVAAGPDGAIYVTDTRIRPDPRGGMADAGTDQIFRVGPDRRPTIALQTERLAKPNGIAWDARGNRFVIVPFGGDTLMTWRPGTTTLEPLATGPGQFDGVVVTDDGRVLVTSKATRSVHELRDDGLVMLIERLGDVADLGWDRRRNRVAVPLASQNRVELYQLAPRR